MMHGLSDTEWRDLVLSVNTHRKQRRLPPCKVAYLIDHALQNTSADQLAKSLGFEDTTTFFKIPQAKSIADRSRISRRLGQSPRQY